MVDAITDEQIKEFREVFNLCDKDGDGSLTIDEVKTAVRLLDENLTEEEFQNMIGEVDEEETVDFPEFLNLMGRKIQLKDYMMTQGEELTDEEIEEMFTLADTDGDGQINYEEFERIMLSPSVF